MHFHTTVNIYIYTYTNGIHMDEMFRSGGDVNERRMWGMPSDVHVLPMFRGGPEPSSVRPRITSHQPGSLREFTRWRDRSTFWRTLHFLSSADYEWIFLRANKLVGKFASGHIIVRRVPPAIFLIFHMNTSFILRILWRIFKEKNREREYVLYAISGIIFLYVATP